MHPYSSIDATAAWKKLCFILSVRSDFHIIDSLLIAVHAFVVLRTSIDKIRENGFELTKKRSRRYPAKTITDADYADDIAILANTANQAEHYSIVWNKQPQV